MKNKIIIVLLGAPGVGKGTQALLLGNTYGIPVLSTGELLRELTKENSTNHLNLDSILVEIKNTIVAGKLVNDEMICKVLENRTTNKDCNNGFVLDGFPRTTTQAKNLEQMLEVLFKKNNQNKIDNDLDSRIKFAIINIDVNEEELIKRLTSRFICNNCKKVYNKISCKTKIENICDICGGANFFQREDDKEDVVKQRMLVYKEQTKLLINYYGNYSMYFSVNGMDDVNVVFGKIIEFINGVI